MNKATTNGNPAAAEIRKTAAEVRETATEVCETAAEIRKTAAEVCETATEIYPAPAAPLRRIAITGGIGTGKSHICRLLEARGIRIFNCDLVAKEIIAHDPDVRAQLAHLVGGEPTRERLGNYLRAGHGNDRRVNAIVHPRVAQAFIGCGLRWMECAILFESGFDSLVHDIVVVTCPTAERIRRIIHRDHCDADTARRWMVLQLTDEERMRRAEAHKPSAEHANPSAEHLQGRAEHANPNAENFHGRAEHANPNAEHLQGRAEHANPGAENLQGRVFHIINDGNTPLEPQLDDLLTQL